MLFDRNMLFKFILLSVPLCSINADNRGNFMPSSFFVIVIYLIIFKVYYISIYYCFPGLLLWYYGGHANGIINLGIVTCMSLSSLLLLNDGCLNPANRNLMYFEQENRFLYSTA